MAVYRAHHDQDREDRLLAAGLIQNGHSLTTEDLRALAGGDLLARLPRGE